MWAVDKIGIDGEDCCMCCATDCAFSAIFLVLDNFYGYSPLLH
jgi:hypothetical protein